MSKSILKVVVVFIVGFCMVNVSYTMSQLNTTDPPEGDVGKLVYTKKTTTGGGCDPVNTYTLIYTDKGYVFEADGELGDCSIIHEQLTYTKTETHTWKPRGRVETVWSEGYLSTNKGVRINVRTAT